jgi:hypothetical protein
MPVTIGRAARLAGLRKADVWLLTAGRPCTLARLAAILRQQDPDALARLAARTLPPAERGPWVDRAPTWSTRVPN